MTLKEELQKVSNKNSPDNILLRNFLNEIEEKLKLAAAFGHYEYRLQESDHKIIKDIEKWCSENNLKLRKFGEGHSQSTCYAISWKD